MLEVLPKPDYKILLRELRPGIRLLRGCDRCNGAIYLERDYYGSYFSCVQAGHTVEPDTDRGRKLTLLFYDIQKHREK